MENQYNHELPVQQILVLPPVKELVPAVQEEILSGRYDPLKFQIFLRKIGKLAEQVVKGEKGAEVEEAFFNEFKKYQDGKSANVFGCRITEQSRSYHDYTHCGDPIWDALKEIEKEVKALIKARETELKAVEAQAQEDDEDFGFGKKAQIAVPYVPKLVKEENTDLAFVNPPIKGSRSSLAFYL